VCLCVRGECELERSSLCFVFFMRIGTVLPSGAIRVRLRVDIKEIVCY
jgi:hypothetical protein